jgi:hypothetical protein
MNRVRLARAALDSRPRKQHQWFPDRAAETDSSTVIAWAAVGLGAQVTALHLLPSENYALSSWFVIGLYGLGFAVVTAVAGRSRAIMAATFGIYAAVMAVVLLGAAWYAANTGVTQPVCLVNGCAPINDDFKLWTFYIYPHIGTRDLELFPGESNAPLHWFANVKLQDLIVAVTGEPAQLAGLVLNGVVGSMTAAFTVGAIDRSLSPSAGHGLRTKNLLLIVLACPWAAVASVLAIREIWVYCVFAAGLYLAFVVRDWPIRRKVVGLLAGVAILGPACFLLRWEMLGVWSLLLLLTAFVADDGERRPLSRYIAFGVMAGVALLAYNLVAAESVQSGILQRAQQYSADANSSELAPGDQGMITGITRQGIVVRGIVETLWIWLQPLPKIALQAGSVYALGKVATPFWTLACLILAGSKPSGAIVQGSAAQAAAVATTVVRRFPFHLIWLFVLTGVVGFTSGETRHLYAAVPLVCVLVANAVHARHDAYSLAVAQRRAAVTTTVALLACVVFTLGLFGRINV